MTRPTLLLLHGWGFDARLWDDLVAAMPGWDFVRWDRGYFGEKAEPEVKGPFAAVGHSLGAMLLAELIAHDVPLIAINGFDQFTGDFGVAPRIVQRMRSRFAENPTEVLTEFRARCGAPPAAGDIDEDRLARDLALLAPRHTATGSDRTLALHGGEDPILPASLRETAFQGAERVCHPAAGHLLPVTHAAWCAEQIDSFLCR